MKKLILLLFGSILLFLVPKQSLGDTVSNESGIPGVRGDEDVVEGPSLFNGSLAQFQVYTLDGDFTAAGTGMRNRGFGTITIGGIPATATVVDAFLYWAILDDTEGSNFKNGTFYGNAITGTLIGSGPDPCWGAGKHFAYRACVLEFITDPGNGSYSLTGFATGIANSQDPWNVGSPTPQAEGATLVILWEDPGNAPRKTVVINDGSVNLQVEAYIDNLTGFTANGTAATLAYGGADGQVSSENHFFNGALLGGGNSWDGSDPVSPPNLSQGNLWDTDIFNVTSQVSNGDNSATSELVSIEDCLTWLVSILSVTTNDDIDFTSFCCEPICNQRTQGFWRRICKDEHPEEPNGVDPYVADVVALGSPVFDGFDAGDLCDLLEVSPPENDPCHKAKRQFLALLLNISSVRLTPCNSLVAGGTVQDAIDDIKALLASGSTDDCKDAQSLAAGINEGTVLTPCPNSSPSLGYKLIESEDTQPYSSSSKETTESNILFQNFLNPFRSETVIKFNVSGETTPLLSSPAQRVKLSIYNLAGQRVKSLVDGTMESGHHVVTWNGTDEDGVEVPSNTYFYRLTIGSFTQTRKMTLLR